MENQQNTTFNPEVNTVEQQVAADHPQFTAPTQNAVTEAVVPPHNGTEGGPSPMFPQNKKSKKPLIIGLLIGAVVLLLGSVGIGAYAFMNTPEAKIANATSKMQKMKKADGTLKLDGSMTVPYGYKSETIKMKVDGTFDFSRMKDTANYFSAKMNADISGSKDVQKMIDSANINGEYSVALTKDMIIEWAGMKQKGSYQIPKDQQKTIKEIIENGSTESEEKQKATQELSSFLIKGYKPILTNDGNKVVVKIDKAELEKLVSTVEKNITSDSSTFEKLYKAVYKDVKDREVKQLVENAKNGNMKSGADQVLKALESFEMKIALEDLGNQVKQTVSMKMVVSQKQAGTTVKMDMNVELDTTYSL